MQSFGKFNLIKVEYSFMEKAMATMLKNLKENTGKDLKKWVQIVKKQNLEKHGQRIKYLKTEHDFTHGFANLVAHYVTRPLPGERAEATIDLVEMQYEKKPDLLPIYEKLLKEVKKFGKDVEIAPKKAYVSLRAKTQFALIQPSTKTRIDVGIKLKDEPVTDRLESSASFNSMVSHRVRVASVKEVDKTLINWLKRAYFNAK